MEDATERAIIRTAIHQDRINPTPRDGNGAEQPATAIMPPNAEQIDAP